MNRALKTEKTEVVERLMIVLIMGISIWFFMQVFRDLTWFEDELRGNWFLKRLICSAVLSSGYLLQYSWIKNRYPKTSKFTLIFIVSISFLWPIIGSTNTKILFGFLILLLLVKTKIQKQVTT